MYSLVVLLVIVACSSAFTPKAVVPASRAEASVVTKTTLYLDLPADPLVLAAVGVAAIGAIGSAVISGKLQEIEGEDASPPPTPAPAPAPAAAAPAAASNEVDLSIPYDAPAKLAYEAAGSPGDYAAFKTKYEADAVADVKAKQK